MENLKKFFSSKIFIAIVVIIFLFIFFEIGYYAGLKNKPDILKITSLSNKEKEESEITDFSVFWKAWNTLNDKFVPTAKNKGITDQEKIWGAIEGLTRAYGDPYTTFFPPIESEIFESEINGNFEGVGMEVGIKDGVLTVISPLKGSPAFKAGIKSGDRIIKISDKITSDLSVDRAVKLIRGKKGTEVVLVIVREGVKNSIEIKIIRDVIMLPTLDTELRKDGIFVIKFYSFTAMSPNLFRNALRSFVDSGTDKMIIDLRGNPGGYLDAAVDIASWFLPVGKVVVRQDFGKGTKEEIYRSKGYNIFNDNLKLIILVDGGSASASEILAGALREQRNVTLVGSKTFGKGSVQEVVKLTPETSLKITISRWLTPNGVSISDNGIIPDVQVEINPKINGDDIKEDVQINKAVELLLKK